MLPSVPLKHSYGMVEPISCLPACCVDVVADAGDGPKRANRLASATLAEARKIFVD